jgi:hypothetical protein
MADDKRVNQVLNDDKQRMFTFTLLNNNHIVASRDFVAGTFETENTKMYKYNENATNSLDFMVLAKYHVNKIKDHLKNETALHALTFINEYYINNKFEFSDKKDSLTYVLKETNTGKVWFSETWDATVYPTRVRNSVNIKHLTKEFIRDYQQVLTSTNSYLNFDYLGKNTNVNELHYQIFNNNNKKRGSK